VLSFVIPRGGAITEHGMTLTTPQGVAEAINFQEAGIGKVATTADAGLSSGVFDSAWAARRAFASCTAFPWPM